MMPCGCVLDRLFWVFDTVSAVMWWITHQLFVGKSGRPLLVCGDASFVFMITWLLGREMLRPL